MENIGYDRISHLTARNELRFSRNGGTNPSSVSLKLDTLKYHCFSTGDFGNLYTLVMNRQGLNFPQALEYVADLLDISKSGLSSKIRYPFGGFYRSIMKELDEPELTMKTYSKDILGAYENKYNMMFLNDGIDFDAQRYFNIGYDIETNRISVPQYTLIGDLCGIMGRLNDLNCDKSERWFPILPCSRSLTLYGYHQNYAKIQRKNVVVVGESEKFVMQLHSMGCHVGLATCGCDISKVQARYLRSLMTKKIILAYDEGLSEEQIREQAKKLMVGNLMFRNKVGYIYDKNGEIIPKGSKGSPSDYGKDAFKELYKNHVVWMEGGT